MLTFARRCLGQAAGDVSMELASNAVRNGISPAYLLPSKPRVSPPFTPCFLRSRSVVYLDQPLQPQLAKIDHVYQRGFIGVCQALGEPSNRFVGFINSRCNSPLHFKNHVLRLASHGVNVIGLYNPCIPKASKAADY